MIAYYLAHNRPALLRRTVGRRSWSRHVGHVVLAAVLITFQYGPLKAEAQEPDPREARILTYIMERNPKASLHDFSALPAVLLESSSRARLDYRVVMALVDQESAWQPRAVGSAGEIGLMQIKPSTATFVAPSLGIVFVPPVKRNGRYLSLGTLGDPTLNLRIGLAHIKDLVRSLGPTPAALRAFNRGETRAHMQVPGDRYAETIGLKLVAILNRFPN